MEHRETLASALPVRLTAQRRKKIIILCIKKTQTNSERGDKKNVVTSHVNRWRINNGKEIQSHA